ncbi:hypothetical protein ACFX10_005165 [Malus domestica]
MWVLRKQPEEPGESSRSGVPAHKGEADDDVCDKLFVGVMHWIYGDAPVILSMVEIGVAYPTVQDLYGRIVDPIFSSFEDERSGMVEAVASRLGFADSRWG